MVVLIAQRNRHRATTSAVADAARVADRAIAVETVEAATLPGVAARARACAVARTLAVAVAGLVAMSQAMSAATAARKDIRPASAGRRSGMRRCTPRKQRRRMNQLCSWQAR
jgi:hypothetical protein